MTLRRAFIALAFGWMLVGAAAPAAGQTVSPEGTQPGGLAGATAPADVANMCRSCHTGGLDDDGKAFRPWETWSGTMMANATRDPLFLAALTVSEQDAPGSGAYCLRCHTPKGFVKGNATGKGAALDADDQQGVDCEACHQSIDASVAQPSVMHDGMTLAGFAALDAQAPLIGNAQLYWDPRDVRHGPYDDAGSPAHAAAGNRFTGSSELCGQCHEVLSPLRNLLDAALLDTGFPFPLDNTYTEWASSDYARPGTMKSCADCHMPEARGDSLTVSTFPSAMLRANPRMHLFVGGNEWGLEAVKLAAPSIATDREASFAAAAEAVRAMLASALRIEVTPGPAQTGATTFDVQVRVTNLSGHKFPTGYADGRRAFLQVELQDAQGQSLGLLGRYDAAAARIDAASELRVWESIQAEHLSGGGHREWHIAKNDTIVKDNRIPPSGFRPTGAAAIAMTAPVGADYGPVTGMRNYDDVAVHFTALQPLPAGSLRVTARVFYQSTMREFVEELARANTTDDRGSRLLEIWEQTGKAAPRLIASASVDLTPGAPIVGDGGSDGPAAGGDSGCGCSFAPPNAGVAAIVFLLALLAGPACRRESNEVKARRLMNQARICTAAINDKRTLNEGDFDCAIAPLNRAAALTPNDPEIYFDRAMHWNNMDKHAEAIADFTRCLDLDANDRSCRDWRSRAYEDTKEFLRAAQDCELVIRRTEPGNQNPGRWADCAELLWQAKRPAEAEALLLEYFAKIEAHVDTYKREGSAPARILSRLYLSLGRTKEAVRFGKMAYENPNRVPRDVEDYVLALEAAGELASAKQIVEKDWGPTLDQATRQRILR